MNERFLEDITSGIDNKYINETAKALYENDSRNTTSSDDLVIVEKKNKKFPFALMTAAVMVIAVISTIAGIIIFNNQSFNPLGQEKKEEYPLFNEDMLAVEKGGKWGYINKKGEWVIEPQFDEACAFQENGYAIVGIETKDDKGLTIEAYGLIDKSGNYVIEPKFSLLYPFDDNGLALVKDGESAWYIDISGNALTEPGFDSSKTRRFWSNDYAVVGNRTLGDLKVGVIDSKGKYILGPQYDDVFILENGCFMVENKDVTEGSDTVATERSYGVVDKNGNIILPIEYYSIICGDDGIYAVQHYGDAYHVDKNGNPLYDKRFDYVSVFNEYGVAVARTKDNMYGLIDKSGNFIAQPVYTRIENWGSFGTYLVEKDGKYGYINYKNEKITDIVFEHAEIFKENGLAIVIKDGRYGCINLKGEFAINPAYLSLTDFTDGLAVAETKDGFILINEKGEQVTKKAYGYLGNIGNERLAFYDGKQTFGYLDYNGNVIFSQVFGEDVSLWVNSYSDDGYTVVYNLDEKGKIKGSGIIDREGNFVSDLCFGGYYAYEYVEEIISDREPDIIIKISEEDKDNTPFSFPSYQIDNKIYAKYVITDGMTLNAENIDTWFPYSYESRFLMQDWYIVKNENNQKILKSGKRPTTETDGDFDAGADILIGDDSLKNYSLEIKFRFAEGEELYFSLYESTLKGEAINPDANHKPDMCYKLTADGKLYKVTPQYFKEEFITEIGELDHSDWHTLLIENIDGSLQLIFDGKNYGEITKVDDNQYGAFGIGGFEIEIEKMVIHNTEKPATPETTLPDNEDKPLSAITFPSSYHTNDITAYQVITDGMKLNADNINVWLPYASNLTVETSWYIEENDSGGKIIKSSKRPEVFAPAGGNLCPDMYIGDYSIRNYSLLVRFRFSNSEIIKLGLYYDTFVTESDFAVDMPSLGWFELDSNGKLYRTGVFSNKKLVMDIGEIDKDSYHTIQIENDNGSLQLIFDGKNYGEIAKVDDNQYGAFGVGGFEIEIEEMSIYDTEKYDAPIFNFDHLPGKLRNEFWKAEIGTDIKDRERIGLISAFVTGDTSLLPEDTDSDVRRIFEEIYSTIVIKDYFIDVADDSLHFIASYQGKSIVKPYDEYAIYDFNKPAVNLTHDDRCNVALSEAVLKKIAESEMIETEFELIRINKLKDDFFDGWTEEIVRFFKNGDPLHLSEKFIIAYSIGDNGYGERVVMYADEYRQRKTESDLALDYLGNTELALTPEDVIYAYQKYLNEQNWELLNVLWYGNEMKWCGSEGDKQNMFSDMKITGCKNVTDEKYADRFDIGINELIYHITYESESMGEGSMFIKLKNDGANYYIRETFTG